MSILSGEGLGHSYNDTWLFRDLYFGFEKGDRVALVGINGAGKSTLLKILSGILKPGSGKVVTERNLKTGYLEQDPAFDSRQSISDFIYSADDSRQQLVREYEEIIASPDPDEKKLNSLINELSNQNAWDYEYQIKTILGRLGILHLDQKISTLSGGQKKRLALAKLLIDDPDMLILDEPTNHLDIETIEWLESYLSSGQKTILLVTHDRYFLDNVSSKILELDRGKLSVFKGNYSYYLEKKAENEEAENNELFKNKNLLRKELEWMRRMPKARSTKSKSRIDSFYKLEEKTNNRAVRTDLELSIRTARQGNKILELEDVSKSFQSRRVVSDFTYIFKKGDRIGIAGKNGSGKSTLLNLITGTLQPDSGKVVPGDTTVFGYYKQGGMDFDGDERVIDVVKNVAEFITMADGKVLTASQVLTHFLFPPAKQYGMVNKLSGGERKRLQLMRVLMKNPNFIILDEPTNDLDIDTLNVLEDFLVNFPGILVLVSHDRYLIDRLTDQLFIFEDDGSLRIYNGNYTDYRFEQEENKSKAISVKTDKIKMTEPIFKLSFKEEQQLLSLETKIESIEAKLLGLTRQLNDIGSDHKSLSEVSSEIGQLQAELDDKTANWIKLIELKENAGI